MDEDDKEKKGKIVSTLFFKIKDLMNKDIPGTVNIEKIGSLLDLIVLEKVPFFKNIFLKITEESARKNAKVADFLSGSKLFQDISVSILNVKKNDKISEGNKTCILKTISCLSIVSDNLVDGKLVSSLKKMKVHSNKEIAAISSEIYTKWKKIHKKQKLDLGPDVFSQAINDRVKRTLSIESKPISADQVIKEKKRQRILNRMKKVSFPEDESLFSIQYFELNEEEQEARMGHSINQKEGVYAYRLFKEMIQEDCDWIVPKRMPSHGSILKQGEESKEKHLQNEREKNSLSVEYLTEERIPETPSIFPETCLDKEKTCQINPFSDDCTTIKIKIKMFY